MCSVFCADDGRHSSFMFFLLYKTLYLLTKNFMESSPEVKQLVYSAAADVKRIGECKKEEAASKE